MNKIVFAVLGERWHQEKKYIPEANDVFQSLLLALTDTSLKLQWMCCSHSSKKMELSFNSALSIKVYGF